MGNEQSVFKEHGYTPVGKVQGFDLVKTKEGNRYLVRQIQKDVEVIDLKQIKHPHIVRHKSFQESGTLYVLMEYWDGVTLAQKIQARNGLSEEEVMDWFVKICMGLSHLHSKHIVHGDIKTQNIFFTECGTVCLGELAKITERACANVNSSGDITNMPPEILKGEDYSKMSDIWALGCLLFELCMQKAAFCAENPVRLVPKILSGSYEALPDRFSPDLQELLSHMLQTEALKRASVEDILHMPFITNYLVKQGRKTHAELKECVTALRGLADGLENFHYRSTVTSITGGVFGVAGGVTSIVGLILAPFTLGASLIVTGVGVGVAALGGATAGVSNISNVVNQTTDRRNVKNLIIKFQEKMDSLVCCLEYIGRSARMLEQTQDLENDCGELGTRAGKMGVKVGTRIGRGISAIPELVRLTRVLSLGRVAAQTARAVRVVEVLGGVFSAFFIAVDVFFIAMDAKEIHHIRQARDEGQRNSNSEGDAQSRSELMRFVLKIRETVDELERVVNEFDIINSIFDSESDDGNL